MVNCSPLFKTKKVKQRHAWSPSRRGPGSTDRCRSARMVAPLHSRPRARKVRSDQAIRAPPRQFQNWPLVTASSFCTFHRMSSFIIEALPPMRGAIIAPFWSGSGGDNACAISRLDSDRRSSARSEPALCEAFPFRPASFAGSSTPEKSGLRGLPSGRRS
jgi:hypothetical protein